MRAAKLDPQALPAYRLFRDETARQFEFLTRSRRHGGLGIAIEIRSEDPYPDAAAMALDLAECDRLRVYATAGSGNEHPFLTNDENDMFRAVHDVFGHASIGVGFDPHGEEAAWLRHSAMYSPLARRALTTETRGQNCALVCWYGGKRFAEQKAVLLADEFCDPRNVTILPGTNPGTDT